MVRMLFGGSASASGDAASAVATLRKVAAEGAEAKGVAAEEKDPVTLSAVSQFKKALTDAKSLDAALGDPRVLKVLLPALGLADQTGNAGLVRKALLADPTETDGLLANLGTTWKQAAETLNLREGGLAALQDASMQATVVKGYVQYQYRQGLDETQPGMSDALYFLEQAGSADGVYDILGNTVLRRVVTGALGLPAQIAIQPVETQARAITSRLKLEELQDPARLRKLAERYVIAAANDAAAQFSDTPDLATLSVQLRSFKA